MSAPATLTWFLSFAVLGIALFAWDIPRNQRRLLSTVALLGFVSILIEVRGISLLP